MIDYNSNKYKITRCGFVGYNTFDYFISLLVTDAFLANLLSYMGFSDSAIGVISSLTTFAFLFKLASIALMQKMTNVKKTTIICTLIHDILFVFTYLIPFINISLIAKIILVFLCVLFAYCSRYLVMSVVYNWGNSYINPPKRSVFLAVMEMISLATGMIFTLAVGQIVDKYNSSGNAQGGFIFLSCAVFVLAIGDLISLLIMKSGMGNGEVVKPKKTPMKDVISHIIKNKSYKKICFLAILWNVGRYTVIGYLGIYKTKELLLSIGFVQIINIIANICRFFISAPMGRFSDKYSYAKGIELGILFYAVGVFALIFCNPNTWWIIVFYTIMSNLSLAGTNQNFRIILYDYVEKDYYVQASAIKDALGGVLGFVSSIIAGKILTAIQLNGNMFLGIHIYGQQLLATISFIIIISALLFAHFVVSKQKITEQKNALI